MLAIIIAGLFATWWLKIFFDRFMGCSRLTLALRNCGISENSASKSFPQGINNVDISLSIEWQLGRAAITFL